MGATAAVHPADSILQAYGLRKLDDILSVSVSQHLKKCDFCQKRVAELSSDEFLGRLQQAKVKPDKRASDWSPSEGSSLNGATGSVVPPRPASTLPPELVDHPDWEIIRELGRGGMGVVYLAKNKLMGRLEVLKVVGRHLVERPGVLDRFLREIQSAARLQHPNIVTAHSAIRLGQGLVLTMEYVEGLDLAAKVKSQGPLPVAHACYFIHQAALGLQHALERGMVHRDIKPANLILARDGKKAIVKVLDFGLAKVTSEGQTDSNLTREGQMLGTPDYIAPEQIRNAQSADIRADIYSLGCTFYYLLTGGPPFRGDHLWDVYQAHFSMDASPLNLVRPEVPAELAAVAAKMMAKEPARRFQTPGEVARALMPFFKKGDAASTVPEPTPELSLGEPTGGTFKPSRMSTVSTEPVADLAPPISPNRLSTVPAPDPGWEKLIELGETDSLTDVTLAAPEPAPAPRSLWPSVAAAVLICTLLAALAAGVFSRRVEEPQPASYTAGGERTRDEDQVLVNASREIESPKETKPADLATQSGLTVIAEAPKTPNSLPRIGALTEQQQRVTIHRVDSHPQSSSETAKANRANKPTSVDVRQIKILADIRRLANPDAVAPSAGFWPSLSPGDRENWQIGDPDHIAMNEKGVRLEAGPNGNLMLTRDASYRTCSMTVTLSAKADTEAFLALRARHGPQGWQAITARVNGEAGKIRVGHQATDFQPLETGRVRKDLRPTSPSS